MTHPSAIVDLVPYRMPMMALGAAVMVAALALPNSSAWAPFLMLAIPLVAAWTVRRTSILASLALAQVSIYYGLTWLILQKEPQPVVVALVVGWASGLAIGALTVRREPAAVVRRVWTPARWPHFVLATSIVALEAALVTSGNLGIGAQLAMGVSTPTGILGILSTVGPLITLMLLITTLGAGQKVAAAFVLVLVQDGVLAMSGFRGAPIIFLISMFAAAALTLPLDSKWRRPWRVAVAGAVLVGVGLMTFSVAATIKDRVATDMGVSSSGTQLFGWSEAPAYISNRLDLGPPLSRAVEMQDDSSVATAVSWVFQIQALIPRTLWPDKPTIDYGQRISAAVYGQSQGQSSSTITTIGDTLVNFSMLGVGIAAVLLGLLLSLAERRIRTGMGLPTLALAAGLSGAIVGQESALILIASGLIRNVLVASVLWLACQAVCTRLGLDTTEPRPARQTGKGTPTIGYRPLIQSGWGRPAPAVLGSAPAPRPNGRYLRPTAADNTA